MSSRRRPLPKSANALAVALVSLLVPAVAWALTATSAASTRRNSQQRTTGTYAQAGRKTGLCEAFLLRVYRD
jgi:hypothetical protein